MFQADAGNSNVVKDGALLCWNTWIQCNALRFILCAPIVLDNQASFQLSLSLSRLDVTALPYNLFQTIKKLEKKQN